jgi:hypothetical protein
MRPPLAVTPYRRHNSTKSCPAQPTPPAGVAREGRVEGALLGREVIERLGEGGEGARQQRHAVGRRRGRRARLADERDLEEARRRGRVGPPHGEHRALRGSEEGPQVGGSSARDASHHGARPRDERIRLQGWGCWRRAERVKLDAPASEVELEHPVREHSKPSRLPSLSATPSDSTRPRSPCPTSRRGRTVTWRSWPQPARTSAAAHPFNWTSASFDKVLERHETRVAHAA